jgi:hypothetical protein
MDNQNYRIEITGTNDDKSTLIASVSINIGIDGEIFDGATVSEMLAAIGNLIAPYIVGNGPVKAPEGATATADSSAPYNGRHGLQPEPDETPEQRGGRIEFEFARQEGYNDGLRNWPRKYSGDSAYSRGYQTGLNDSSEYVKGRFDFIEGKEPQSNHHAYHIGYHEAKNELSKPG